jgi:hypothetical protein
MRVLKFVFSHSFFAAACAAGLSWQTGILLNQTVTYSLLLYVFFSTLAGYNFYWIIAKKTSVTTISASFIKQISSYLILLITSSLLMLYLFAQLPQLWIPSFVSASCTVVYSWPLWKNSPKRMFLSMGVLKTFLLAITWTYVTIWFPLAGKMLEWTPDFLLHLSFRFLFMLILCILFDKRDLEADQKRSYSSVATVFTDKQLKLLCNACFLLMLLVSLLSWKTNSSQTVLLSNLASVAAAYLLYRLSFKPRGYYFYYFLVDGLMLFSAMVTFIVHKLFFS